MLDEAVTVTQHGRRSFFLLEFVIDFGGLAFGLLILGYLLSRMGYAKTFFFVKFTEAMFSLSVNVNGKLDFPESGAEQTIRPLKLGEG